MLCDVFGTVSTQKIISCYFKKSNKKVIVACPFSTWNRIDYASSDSINIGPCIDLPICSNYIKV